MNTLALPANLGPDWDELLESWRDAASVRRLWAKDPSVWTGADEGQWLAWLDIVTPQLGQAGALHAFAKEVREAGLDSVLLLGMGGSSLCPETLSLVFGLDSLHVLDSTDPAQLLALEENLDLTKTLFIVASKSGSTLEPEIMRSYFFDRAGKAIGAAPGDRFVAITDPGSHLEEVARRDGYRKIFYGVPAIGGRYSALSNFGMVPGAAAGLEIERVLTAADEMARACRRDDPANNPGVLLGLALGTLARQGRDKLTFIASDGLLPLGAWLEQLIAESTGKIGKAIIPVDLETPGPPESYGDDRVFAVLQLGEDLPHAAEVAALEAAGHPVAKIKLADAFQIGAEFFRWEIATAVAGAVLGIHPFNQPDVQASKDVAKKLTNAYEETGRLASEYPFYSDADVELYADDFNAALLTARAGGADSLESLLAAHLDSLQPGRYFGLLAYVEMSPAHVETLQRARHAVRDGRRAATCLGFGPRFLHSTGQAYKGGPNSGVFLQVTCDDARDAPVPGKSYTFGVVKAAQARGDFAVLVERRRRALRVHLKGNVAKGLERLGQALAAAAPKA
ncbi:MAG: bifunctional transaldolase/phosoglucose isomerase [Acidobacteria bacterium]|nr:bifunctional transaldolase/phosoglucose isomerase [Acidobacteriota bacterium]